MNNVTKAFGYLFYIVNPHDHLYNSLDQVPDYMGEAIPLFVVLIFIEQIILILKGWKKFRVHDSLISTGQGILMEQSKILLKSLIIYYYIEIYSKYAIIKLENTLINWLIALIAVDFLFYWFHRASHEINILWAFHQAHHSSEHFNLTTALRQSIFQVYFHCFFNLPLALFLSPPMYMVHLQLNVLYQFWIHTDLLPKLGPLELILNTPSAHRVHHGRNRYCIDKNYAGVLIVWDKIFGTYQEERETIAYGLVHPINTFDPLTIQTWNLVHIWKQLTDSTSFSHKLSVLFKGPGWSPGKPRLGLVEDVPLIDGTKVIKYDPIVGLSTTVYVGLHSIFILILHLIMMEKSHLTTYPLIISGMFVVFFSIYSLSKLLESEHNYLIETIRCILLLGLTNFIDNHVQILNLISAILPAFRIFFLISLMFCATKVLLQVRTMIEKRKIN